MPCLSSPGFVRASAVQDGVKHCMVVDDFTQEGSVAQNEFGGKFGSCVCVCVYVCV